MNDATGKSKSQQVIVLENIFKLFRIRETTIMKMTAAIESIMESNSVEDDELDEILVVVKGIYLEHIRDLEEAVEVGGAMPTLIEGNTGAFKCILQPSALLMHRYDGAAMRGSPE
jgi:CII-binding regulator of phage lambda lysogenization HflD